MPVLSLPKGEIRNRDPDILHFPILPGPLKAGCPAEFGGELVFSRNEPAAFLCVLIFLTAIAAPSAAMSRKPAEPAYVPGELIVKFREDVPSSRAAEIIRTEGARIGKFLVRTRLYLVVLPEGVEVRQAVKNFSRYREVISAEPNYLVKYPEDR